MHGVILFCCKEVNQLATLISKPAPFLDTVGRMTAAASTFYDNELGLFASGTDRQISWVSQAWLVLAGAMDLGTCLRAIKAAMKHPGAIKPLTPYAYHRVAEALARSGGAEECIKLMKEYWGSMVRAGADTLWESFDPEDSRKSPYGDCHNNSYCHAWSFTRSYLLRIVLKDYLERQSSEQAS